MDTNTTFGLRFDQLAEILAVGCDVPAAGASGKEHQETAEALDRQLRTVLPEDSILLNSVLDTISRLGCDMKALSGRSLLDVLLDAKTDLALLNTIKDRVKSNIVGSIAKREISVATAIYYAAIASGLVYHHKKITAHSADKLTQSFAILKSKPWVPPELVNLYSRASDLCKSDEDNS